MVEPLHEFCPFLNFLYTSPFVSNMPSSDKYLQIVKSLKRAESFVVIFPVINSEYEGRFFVSSPKTFIPLFLLQCDTMWNEGKKKARARGRKTKLVT